ncbi:hypothetical protein EWB00_008482, partial [Schistosoma japonicum]
HALMTVEEVVSEYVIFLADKTVVKISMSAGEKKYPYNDCARKFNSCVGRTSIC